MFNELVESCVTKRAGNRSWALIASGAGQSIVLSLLILAPLIYTQALPKTLLTSFLLAPVPPARVVRGESMKRLPQPHQLHSQQFTAPAHIPPSIAIVADNSLSAPDVSDPQTSSIFESIPGQNPIQIAAPPKPTAPEIKPVPRIKQGGSVQQAMLVSQTRPAYPPLAIQAHIQGDVVLHAVIDAEGRVSELQVISGHPLLIRAALEAVRQWRYRPTMLNGEPVEVDTTITVLFRIGG
jgi:periplasmic protein TonB